MPRPNRNGRFLVGRDYVDSPVRSNTPPRASQRNIRRELERAAKHKRKPKIGRRIEI